MGIAASNAASKRLRGGSYRRPVRLITVWQETYAIVNRKRELEVASTWKVSGARLSFAKRSSESLERRPVRCQQAEIIGW
jgi:hypothetical protein